MDPRRAHPLIRPHLLVLLTCTLLGATACSGTDAPEVRPEPATSRTTSTPSASPTPPPGAPASLTSAAEGETAEQFIRRWIELGNYMQATGDTSAYRAAAAPICDTCTKVAARVQEIYGSGGVIRGGSDEVRGLKPETPTTWVADLLAKPTEITNGSGQVVETFPGGERRSRLLLTQVEGRWYVGATESVK